MNLLIVVYADCGLGHLHHGPVQLHGDPLDVDVVSALLPLQLDVEALVVGLAVSGQDVGTGEGQLEEVSVEGPEVVVTPRAAELTVAVGPQLLG